VIGWIFIGVGVVLIAIGSLSIYYGQDLLRRGTVSSSISASSTAPLPIINPPHERLLSLIHKYQVQFGATKLVIARSGLLHFDDPEQRERFNINLAAELFESAVDPTIRSRQFEALMEGMPAEYLRMIPESRLDNPFVVMITEAGIRYLKQR